MKSGKILASILCAVLLASDCLRHGFGSNLALCQNVSGAPSLPKVRGSLKKSQDYRGVELADISIVDKTRLFAVGAQKREGEPEQAVLLGTSDGGKTWRRMLVNRGMWFYAVHFINPKIGWIVGYDGLILKSTDAGMTWIKQRTPVESSFIRIQIIDQQSGWVMGKDGELLHTSDGGNSWTSHKLEGHGWVWSKRSGHEFRGWLTSFYFSDNLNGWLVGQEGKVYQSTDGGVSWESRGTSLIRNIPEWGKSVVTFQAVKFLSTKVGFIAATVRPKEERDLPPKGILLKTEDGGVTWACTVVTREDSLVRVEILNDKEIWAIPGFGNRLLRTENAGKTWISVNLPDEVGRAINVRFVVSQTGWLISNDGMFADEILYTVDGGRTWTEAKLGTQ